MFTHKRERDRGREGGEREQEREGEGKREERQHYDRLPTCTLNPFKDRKEGTSGQRYFTSYHLCCSLSLHDQLTGAHGNKIS